ncbi:MAG: hypothetical protein R2839_00760 [Thermomicrobiales bacterium]
MLAGEDRIDWSAGRRQAFFIAASELACSTRNWLGTIFGPGSIAQAHSPNEFVLVDELLTAASVMALTIATWCN